MSSNQLDCTGSVTAMPQRHDGEADMPGGLTMVAFARDPYRSTRPQDNFRGRRKPASLAYEYKPDR